VTCQLGFNVVIFFTTRAGCCRSTILLPFADLSKASFNLTKSTTMIYKGLPRARIGLTRRTQPLSYLSVSCRKRLPNEDRLVDLSSPIRKLMGPPEGQLVQASLNQPQQHCRHNQLSYEEPQQKLYLPSHGNVPKDSAAWGSDGPPDRHWLAATYSLAPPYSPQLRNRLVQFLMLA
jgi:hypothetical protein